MTLPAATICTPTIDRINVDLPHPLGPSKPVTERLATESETSCRTARPPRSTSRPSTVIAAPASTVRRIYISRDSRLDQTRTAPWGEPRLANAHGLLANQPEAGCFFLRLQASTGIFCGRSVNRRPLAYSADARSGRPGAGASTTATRLLRPGVSNSGRPPTRLEVSDSSVGLTPARTLACPAKRKNGLLV